MYIYIIYKQKGVIAIGLKLGPSITVLGVIVSGDAFRVQFHCS